jgi:heat shock protein HslJ
LALGAHVNIAMAQTTPSIDPELASTQWRVLTVRGVPAANGETLEFGEGRITGKAACNSYSAAIRQAANLSLEISGPVTTRMFCHGKMDAERVYLDALQAARRYTIGKGTLSLQAADGRTLITLGK